MIHLITGLNSETRLWIIVGTLLLFAGIGVRLRRRKPEPSVQLVDTLESLPPTVANAVRTVLMRCPPYEGTSRGKLDGIFQTTVRAPKSVLGTRMTVQLEACGTKTNITIRIYSEWFMRSRNLSVSHGHIHNFMMALREELKDKLIES